MSAYNSSIGIQTPLADSKQPRSDSQRISQSLNIKKNYLRTTNAVPGSFVITKVYFQGQQKNRVPEVEFLNAERDNKKLDPVGEIKKRIEFRNTFPNEILYFLETNRHLIPLIHSSVPFIDYFFPGSRLIAELSSDTESDVQHRNIVIYIRTSLSVEETLRRLEEFDQRWGNNLYLKSGRKILIMEEFE